MPGAITPKQAQNAGAGATASTGLLNDNQAAFASRLSAQTGLDLYVVAAWVHLEEPASASKAPNGANNWLNIGDTGSGNFAGSDPAWSDPIAAADKTAAWLKGQPIAGYGAPSAGIRGILNTAGKSPATQIAAIQHSGWAASGYPSFGSVYTAISGSKSVAAQLANAIGSPLVAAGSVASSIPNAISSTGDFLAKLWSALINPKTWLRIAMGIAALVLLIFGLFELAGGNGGKIAQHVPIPV